ncbi:MAG: hypothetical protein WAM28_03685 [Chlamydiales bacterium]
MQDRKVTPITEKALRELIEESAKHHLSFNENNELTLFPDGLTLTLIKGVHFTAFRFYSFFDINQSYITEDEFFDKPGILRYRQIKRVAILQFIFSNLSKFSAYRRAYLKETLWREAYGNSSVDMPLIYLQTQLSSKLSNKYKWIKSFYDNLIKIINDDIDHIIFQYLGGINLITEEFNEILNLKVERCHLRDFVQDLLFEMIHKQASCKAVQLTQDDLKYLEMKGFITLAADRYRTTRRGSMFRIAATGDLIGKFSAYNLSPLGAISQEDRAYLEEEEEEVRQARERGEEKELNIWIGYRMSGITDKTARLILDRVSA